MPSRNYSLTYFVPTMDMLCRLIITIFYLNNNCNVDMFKCVNCRRSVQRRLVLLENMGRATVPVFVRTLRRWKLPSMANTRAASAARSRLLVSFDRLSIFCYNLIIIFPMGRGKYVFLCLYVFVCLSACDASPLGHV